MDRKKIAVVGWYGHGNCGDESYRLSFPKVFPHCDFVFTESATDAECHILGGGDIVNEAFINKLRKVTNKHIISAAISKPAKYLNEFKTVGVRDMISLANAAASGVVASYVPDFAFALEGKPENGRRIIRERFATENAELYHKVVAVVVNAHLLAEHHGTGLPRDAIAFEHAAFEIANTIDNTCASFVFVPFGTRMPWDDRVTNSWVAAKCKFYKKNVVLYDGLNVQDTIDVIAACDGLISSRLHSTIFSCVTATPFIDLLHNHKNRGFLDTVGLMKYAVPISSMSFDMLHQRLNVLLSAQGVVREELTRVTAKQRCILREFSSSVRLFG
jgi:polysaccharide pyruvyl transferase WcaK-like protein